MVDLKQFEVWFITGSQDLYGEETLNQVADNARQIARGLDQAASIPLRVVWMPTVTSTGEILRICQQANSTAACIGVIAWMHTFSPAKMWITGLKILQKPLLHLHTQFHRDLPWNRIDMDFMNLHQSAHGDREFGFMMTRMRLNRKVVVGHWQQPEVSAQVGAWCRAAAGWHDWQGARFVRFGDNMRYVAVTEGDKVEAEMQFGFSVNTHGIGDLVARIQQVSDQETDQLCQQYQDLYQVDAALAKGGGRHASLREAAKIELGLRGFLQEGGFKGFTDTFEDLHGLVQLPGLAVQRLMAQGYGFGGEGDWKTAALVRAMKVMGSGLPGSNAFMEDYTYHFDPDNALVLGSHMLEVDASLAAGPVRCEVHPLGIGNKADPVRLVFDVAGGPALNASLIDMGNRFRLILNQVQALSPPQPLPLLPVARVLWKPLPDMATAAAAWILAGGAHHTCYSQNLDASLLQDFADIAGLECVHIGPDTRLPQLKKELQWSEVFYQVNRSF